MNNASPKLALSGLLPNEIADALDLKPFQGRQIFRWIHKKRAADVERMTDLSLDLRSRITQACQIRSTEPVVTQRSERSRGTLKALLRLDDGETVEAVLIRDRERSTLCLSTQVGCAVKCSFCATGLHGFKRNLSPSEILDQALHLLSEEDLGDRSPNIVFMGMGEPFRNYDSTVKAVRLLMQKDGLGIGARRITVSTAGEVDGILRFAREDWQVRLSVSLHAANDALRNELVPLNRKYPLGKLMESVREYTNQTGRQLTFEWALLNGVNDRPEDARELVR
jgi:23S rRNA (adenine2503-C2)-methyltransferase